MYLHRWKKKTTYHWKTGLTSRVVNFFQWNFFSWLYLSRGASINLYVPGNIRICPLWRFQQITWKYRCKMMMMMTSPHQWLLASAHDLGIMTTVDHYNIYSTRMNNEMHADMYRSKPRAYFRLINRRTGLSFFLSSFVIKRISSGNKGGEEEPVHLDM